MLRCLTLLVAVLLLTTGSPLFSDWTQVMEASIQQPAPYTGYSVTLFSAVSAGLVSILLATWFSQARRMRRIRYNRPQAGMLRIPRRK